MSVVYGPSLKRPKQEETPTHLLVRTGKPTHAGFTQTTMKIYCQRGGRKRCIRHKVGTYSYPFAQYTKMRSTLPVPTAGQGHRVSLTATIPVIGVPINDALDSNLYYKDNYHGGVHRWDGRVGLRRQTKVSVIWSLRGRGFESHSHHFCTSFIFYGESTISLRRSPRPVILYNIFDRLAIVASVLWNQRRP